MPVSIKRFERLFFFSFFLGVVRGVVFVSELWGLGGGVADVVVTVIRLEFFVLGLFVVLVLLTSRRRSRVSKWILMVVCGYISVATLFQFSVLFEEAFGVLFLSVSQLVVQWLGIYFLCVSESRDWFSKR